MDSVSARGLQRITEELSGAAWDPAVLTIIALDFAPDRAIRDSNTRDCIVAVNAKEQDRYDARLYTAQRDITKYSQQCPANRVLISFVLFKVTTTVNFSGVPEDSSTVATPMLNHSLECQLINVAQTTFVCICDVANTACLGHVLHAHHPRLCAGNGSVLNFCPDLRLVTTPGPVFCMPLPRLPSQDEVFLTQIQYLTVGKRTIRVIQHPSFELPVAQHTRNIPRLISTALIVAAAVLLANVNSVCAAAVNETGDLARRTLSQAYYVYSWQPACCAASSTGCNHGASSVYASATASTGKSYHATSTDWSEVFQERLNGAQHCDSGGIICWSGTVVGDTIANVYVHYANDQICGNAISVASSGGSECVQQAASVVRFSA
ncbi:hypothetical protein C8R45DRAFT_923887 [Mycena sanguinolenta]|nr:hypothetical protein C8R45DRAFT_923887 [Mycena sanguinolenta]